LSLEPESNIMKKPQSKPAVDAGLVCLDASELFGPSVFAAISELPEHRRVLYFARLAEKLARLGEEARAA
jgi:hypothetical protein